jgi:plasmid stabilization system protein ParE
MWSISLLLRREQDLTASNSTLLYEVSLTKDAERDLEEIYFYIAEHDSPSTADHVLDRHVKATEALRTSPDRGSYANELRSLWYLGISTDLF